MLNVISTCRDILCVDISVDKRCIDHSTTIYYPLYAYTDQAEVCCMSPGFTISKYSLEGVQSFFFFFFFFSDTS